MNPLTIQKLMEQSPEMREFRDFLVAECKKVTDLSDIKGVPLSDLPFEIIGRQRAYEKLQLILFPLLETTETRTGTDPKEFVV